MRASDRAERWSEPGDKSISQETEQEEGRLRERKGDTLTERQGEQSEAEIRG